MAETIFSKIIRKEIPASIVYEDELVLAFRDINPKAPVHILIIPKMDIDKIQNINLPTHEDILASLFQAVQKIAIAEGLENSGYRIVINNGDDGGQEVNHLHLHLLGGRKMSWPPG